MTEKLSQGKQILGITDAETVKLDLDDMPFSEVKELAVRITEHFNLEGFLISKSSKNCYHVVFDRTVSWTENVKIMAWVALLLFSKNLKVVKWFVMQCIKQGSTLRISSKQEKPSPRIVFRHGKQDQQISNFLETRKLIKRILNKL